jgi:hypothetical protein
MFLATNGAYAISKCFCCGVPITHLQHHNKHEYNIDSLLNIQFATMLLQHYITYLQQHTSNTNTMLGKYDYNIYIVATPLWPSVGVKPNTPKVGVLESSWTPECLEFDSKAQNTSHWGVLGVIGKVLKRRYRKWPRIGHLDIFSPSYGQKKGRESNWQFDSRPLKVGNRPAPDVRWGSAICR